MQNVEHTENNVIEIDLMELIALLWSRIWLLLLCTVAAGAAGFMISQFVLTEQYESTARIYVLNKQNDASLTYSDVQLGTVLTKDFAEIVKSRYVLERVIATCYLTETPEKLAARINVATKTDTRIITITITDTNPERAQYIADEVCREATERIKYVMNIEAVNVVDEANLPTVPSAPRKGRWTLISAFLGAFICAAVILVHFMLDDTIKTSDDVEKYLGLSTLGMIPIRGDSKKTQYKKGILNSIGGRKTSRERPDIRERSGMKDRPQGRDYGYRPRNQAVYQDNVEAMPYGDNSNSQSVDGSIQYSDDDIDETID